MYIFARIIEKW